MLELGQRRFMANLLTRLRHPIQGIKEFDKEVESVGQVPLWTWLSLVLIAVLGTCIYGASVNLAFPGWLSGSGAFFLTLSTGLSWCLFGPVLILATKLRKFTCAHACLITMAYGEAILFIGACLNYVMVLSSVPKSTQEVVNCSIVVVSNLVMCEMLAIQLEALGVRKLKTLLIWTVVLLGSFAILFWILSTLFKGN